MTSRRNPEAKKNPPGPASPRGENHNLEASQIVPSWAMRGKPPHEPAPSQSTPAPSTGVNPVDETDEAAVAAFLHQTDPLRVVADFHSILGPCGRCPADSATRFDHRVESQVEPGHDRAMAADPPPSPRPEGGWPCVIESRNLLRR